MTVPVPKLLGGRYEVGDLIARGGMAEVHHGYDTRLGRAVAIKILRSDHVRDTHFLSRFRREAQSVAGLNHRNIVAVYDSGEDFLLETGGAQVPVPWIVMEYVEGFTLREILTSNGPLPAQEATRITESILDALAYSHEMGMVHRDIKPANVMVSRDGSVKVMDFGIARAVADTQATMTQTSSVMGTAQYISPEQAEGLPVDSRSDLYSTGCLLFELMTGRTPFIGEPVSLTYQHVSKPPPAPSQFNEAVPEALDAVVAQALVKDRELRYQHAEDFRDDLRSVRLGRPVSAAAYAALRAEAPTYVVAPAEQVPAALSPSDQQDSDPPYAEPRRRWGALAMISSLLLAVGVLGFFARTYLDSRPDLVVVPSVVSKSIATATAELKAAGFDVTQTYQPSRETPRDKVIEQQPRAGSEQIRGTQIALIVSGGPAATKVPPVNGLQLDEATQLIEDAGLTLGDVTVIDRAGYVTDRVVSATPPQFSDAAEGDVVTLVIASGRVSLPDLSGRTQDEARDELSKLRLPVKTIFRESSQAEGTVIQTDPEPGKVDVGTTVTVVLAKPLPVTATRTVTTTPTASASSPPTSTGTSDPSETSTSPPPNSQTSAPAQRGTASGRWGAQHRTSRARFEVAGPATLLR
jgi:serine/threonine protein kinase/beta-lactam-binding protein with PASTA domain